MKEIIDAIGFPAALEQTAEECNELAQACLKLARKLRGENPTPAEMNDLTANLMEEMADVKVCLNVLHESDMVSYQVVNTNEVYKEYRWLNRIRKAENDQAN